MSLVHDLGAKALHLLDPEDAHNLTIRALAAGLGPQQMTRDDPVLGTQIGTLALPNAVGLAAGFDKNAEAPVAMLRAGFGFLLLARILLLLGLRLVILAVFSFVVLVGLGSAVDGSAQDCSC